MARKKFAKGKKTAKRRTHSKVTQVDLPRVTSTNGGFVQVPKEEYMYLGRTVKQHDPLGYSHLSEVKGTVDGILNDHEKGLISRRMVNARLMRLVGIVDQTKLGELADDKNKVKAKKIINQGRKKMGFNPVVEDPFKSSHL